MSDVAETRWFKIITLVFVGVCVAFFAFSFATARSLYRASQNGVNPLTSGDVSFYWWTSLILLIVSIALFIWLAWRLVFAKNFRVNITDTVYDYSSSTEGGFFGSDATSKVAGGKTTRTVGKGGVYS